MIAALMSIFILGLLVIVHEYGHFLMARRAGVNILRFSIGFGTRLFSWKRGETEYAISLIPLGGYVKMAGEQHNSDEPHKPGDYLSKPVGTRAGIVFAGPFVNYIVAIITLWVVFIVGYPELLPVVGKVINGMPAQFAGVEKGDRIKSVDKSVVRTWDEMTKLIYAAPDKPMVFAIERHGATKTITVIPKPKTITDPFGRSKTVGLIGIVPSGEFMVYRTGPISAIGKTIHQQSEWLSQTAMTFLSMLMGKVSLKDSVTGPIGIIFLTSEAVSMGISPLLSLISLFSLSLAIFNLLPIPILDGGHIFFLMLEKFRGRPISANVQERSAQISFAMLMTLVVVICINDLNRFGLIDKLFGWMKP